MLKSIKKNKKNLKSELNKIMHKSINHAQYMYVIKITFQLTA